MFCCHRCRNEWNSEKKQPSPKEFCASCSAYLHCCENCRFHAPGRPNECEIPNTEAVRDRAGCNFCDEFEFRTAGGTAAGEGKRYAARDALDNLFGGDTQADKRASTFGELFDD